MDDTGRDALRARNEALRGQVDSLLETFEQQRTGLADAQTRLASTTVTAWSADNLIRVESTAAGIPIQVHVEPEAFKRSTPEKLGKSITEAVQAAAQQAMEATRQTVAPLEEAAGGVPDLSELVPGAPSIRELVKSLFPQPLTQQAETPPELNEEDEDEYFRNRAYLRDQT